MTTGLTLLSEQYPERLSSIGDTESNIPWSTLLTGMTLITTYYWCTNQGIVQRTFAAKNLAEGQKGVLFAALMKLAGPLYLVLPGIIAWHIAFGTSEPPPANANQAYGYLVNLVLPGWAVGFYAATIFGAILSSFNSFLNSGSTLFSLDLYQGLLRPSATEKEAVKAGKIFGTVTVFVSIALAVALHPFAERQGLFDLMKNIAAVLNIPLLAIVFMGFFSRRAPSAAANIALVAGIVFQSYFGIYSDNTLFGTKLHWLHVAAINFVFLIVLMQLISVAIPRAEAFEQKYSEDVDITPWRLARPIGLTIVVLIAAMYLGMWAKYGVTPGKRLAAQYAELHPSIEPASAGAEGTQPIDNAGE